MLDPAFVSQLTAYQARKTEQLNRALALVVPGLQGSVTANGTLFILRYSVDGFEDTCIIGRPPQHHLITIVRRNRDEKGKRAGDTRETTSAVSDTERPVDKRKIDLSDDDIAAVIRGWQSKKRAVETLEGIAARRGYVEELQTEERKAHFHDARTERNRRNQVERR